MTATVNSISINAVSINGASGAFLTKIWNNLLRKVKAKSHPKAAPKKIISHIVQNADPVEFAINTLQLGISIGVDGERYSVAHDINNVKPPNVRNIQTTKILPLVKIFFKE